MAADWAGVAIAFVLFAALTVLPGYAIGWWLNILRFRQREGIFRLVISVPLAISLMPLLSYLVGRALSLNAVWALFAVLSLLGSALLFQSRGHYKKTKLLWVCAVWCAWALFALCDLQFGRRVYFSIIGFDYAVRAAFVSSISTFGLPAHNPFFNPGQPVMLRYHYYWLIPSALVHRIAEPLVDARHALIAGTLWCGLGLLSITVLYLRFFKISKLTKRQIALAFGLLLVTGLDIFPALFFLVLAKCGVTGALPPSLEWWNDQVDGWLYSMLWEPHYVAGLIAGLFGFLVISQTSKQRLLAGFIAGLAFATSVGAAIYVSFVFTIFLASWSVVALWKRWYHEVQTLAVAGVTAVVFSLPFLRGLSGPGSGGAFTHFTVRTFFAVDILGKTFHWSGLQIHLANLLALPVNYFLELGFFFAVGALEFRRLRQSTAMQRNDIALALMAVVSVTVCTFLRSGVIANNDLGWRGFLIAQFVLLIRGAQLLPTRLPRYLTLLAALGLAGTIYDQALLRFYPLLSDAKVLPKVHWLARDEKLGERTYANHEAYQWLKKNSPATSLIQQNPKQQMQDTFYGLYADRSTVAEDVECATAFGGDPKACKPLQITLQPLFAANASDQVFETACSTLPQVDFVIVKDTDPVWGTAWQKKPVFANAFVRIFRCKQ